MQPLQAFVLVALLLAAQGLGLAHHVLHGQSGQGGHAQAAVWLDGHDDGSADCRLIDQLGHADLALGTQALPPGLPTCSSAPAVRADRVLRAAPAPAYQARAPPRVTNARA
jgi:hypothetical protein